PTRSGFCITPIVMWGQAVRDIDPDPGEVEQVFHIPLHELNGPGMPRLSPPGADGRQVLSAWLPVLGHEMFAPTAALLYQFREVALNARATRVAHFDEPQFAWQ
ncbi:MAG: NUDIX hydrolase, partial [Aestuariivirgaceae bacterium]